MAVFGARGALDRFAALSQSPLFREVCQEGIRRAAERATVRQLAAGQVLFAQGESALTVYLVAQGELRLVRQDARGREQVLSTHGAGAIMALAPAFNAGVFYSTAIADSSALVLCLEAKFVHELCREFPAVLWNAAQELAQTIHHYAETIEILALRNVDQRVAQFLLSLCEQTGARESDCRVLHLTMTQPEMAARVGSTREVVCRALAHLQRRGLIAMHGPHHISIPDIRKLRRFAGIESALAGSDPST